MLFLCEISGMKEVLAKKGYGWSLPLSVTFLWTIHLHGASVV